MPQSWEKAGTSIKDGGSAWPVIQELPVTSADATSTPLDLISSTTPAATEIAVLDDVWVSTDTATLITLRSGTTNTLIWRGRVAANVPVAITQRNALRCPDEGEIVELIAADAGNIYAQVSWHKLSVG